MGLLSMIDEKVYSLRLLGKLPVLHSLAGLKTSFSIPSYLTTTSAINVMSVKFSPLHRPFPFCDPLVA